MSTVLMLSALVLTLAPSLASRAEAAEELYVQVEVASLDELASVARVASIDRVDGARVMIYIVDSRLDELRRLGLGWRELPHPGANPGARMGLLRRAEAGSWDAYPTYSEYVAMMEGFAAEHPGYCLLHRISATTNAARPHELLVLEISDLPGRDEDEPEILLTSTMHGDETVGFVLLLRLAESLLDAAEGGIATPEPEQARMAALVAETSIWINPLANPDGTYFSSDSSVASPIRSFVYPDGSPAPVDPNRNFPDPEDGEHPDGQARWLETQAMIDLAAAQRFVISVNLHCGAEVINYPWDTWWRRHPDDAWLQVVARAWADEVHAAAAAPPYYDSGYLRDLDDGITNGYDWYSVSGGRQDWMTYFASGREVTAEISRVKNPPASSLDALWGYSRGALVRYVERSLEGVRGIVADEDGLPLDATVEIAWLDTVADASAARTDPEVGDYHRPLLPGTYWVIARAEGFVPGVAEAQVEAGPAQRLDLVLEQASGLDVPISGSVRSAASGLPVEGAVVRLTGPEAVQAQTAADGELWLGPLPEGAYLVEVEADGFVPARIVHRNATPASRLEVLLSSAAPAPRHATRRVSP